MQAAREVPWARLQNPPLVEKERIRMGGKEVNTFRYQGGNDIIDVSECLHAHAAWKQPDCTRMSTDSAAL